MHLSVYFVGSELLQTKQPFFRFCKFLFGDNAAVVQFLEFLQLVRNADLFRGLLSDRRGSALHALYVLPFLAFRYQFIYLVKYLFVVFKPTERNDPR